MPAPCPRRWKSFTLPQPMTDPPNGMPVLGLHMVPFVELAVDHLGTVPRPPGDLTDRPVFLDDTLVHTVHARIALPSSNGMTQRYVNKPKALKP